MTSFPRPQTRNDVCNLPPSGLVSLTVQLIHPPLLQCPLFLMFKKCSYQGFLGQYWQHLS